MVGDYYKIDARVIGDYYNIIAKVIGEKYKINTRVVEDYLYERRKSGLGLLQLTRWGKSGWGLLQDRWKSGWVILEIHAIVTWR